ncbi:hypothetical protein BGX27_008499 [Mortierella sp. AM989]|nr:hypothetical protein BGX27_008499 [Mortierella sp. AM989]
MAASGYSRLEPSSQKPLFLTSSSATFGEGFARFVLKMVARHNPEPDNRSDLNLTNSDSMQTRQIRGAQTIQMTTTASVGGATNSSTKRKPLHGADDWSYLWAPQPLSLTLMNHQVPQRTKYCGVSAHFRSASFRNAIRFKRSFSPSVINVELTPHFSGADIAPAQTSSWNSTKRNMLLSTHQKPLSPLSNQTVLVGDTETRPFLLIQSGQETLERFNLDATNVKTIRLKGIMKESIIGFRYNSVSPESRSSEERKLQIKFMSPTECGQCASMLLPYICIKVVGVTQGQQNLDLIKPQDTTRATTANFYPSSISRIEDTFDSQISEGEGEGSSQTQVLSASQPQFFDSQDFVGVGSGGGGGSSSSSQILSQPFAITPRYGMQPIPVCSTTGMLPPAFTPAPNPIDQSEGAPQLKNEIERLLSIPDKDFQDKLNCILVDPRFPELLVKVDLILRVERGRML